MHYLYHERQDENGEWRFTGRTPCNCHIRENHWPERIV
jgi:hypothetical protein